MEHEMGSEWKTSDHEDDNFLDRYDLTITHIQKVTAFSYKEPSVKAPPLRVTTTSSRSGNQNSESRRVLQYREDEYSLEDTTFADTTLADTIETYERGDFNLCGELRDVTSDFTYFFRSLIERIIGDTQCCGSVDSSSPPSLSNYWRLLRRRR